ncbi:prohead peptidase. Unknown type peptidase. MEROPS family U35 [Gemmobacter megaterium]|uniref:Prohead serine protease domain-containing protein n=1 Tax=Gemmobacter megaterium TaxID=1086013 RepID=A0A1N7LQV0_9RHOB|nr:HK97 family phage prohead protease [Gemmobacter megaterium]GGE11083.1 peptidase U35 [Gemmobacter megaterium]SIS76139.1 prohead peptidase. Unknown type peptidase. MEROPS family U35 [Gemmobacter megaterium]
MGWDDGGLERKFHRPERGLSVDSDQRIAGYASLFGATDQGGDMVLPGAYAVSLASLKAGGGAVKMLWQHDPAQPIGVWDEVREDDRGLWVSGRLLPEVARGREAVALIAAGAVDGLSIGYRTKRAEKDGKGRRLLAEVELWEVSLVTFPMLPSARVQAKADAGLDLIGMLTDAFAEARRELAGH